MGVLRNKYFRKFQSNPVNSSTSSLEFQGNVSGWICTEDDIEEKLHQECIDEGNFQYIFYDGNFITRISITQSPEKCPENHKHYHKYVLLQTSGNEPIVHPSKLLDILRERSYKSKESK